MREQLEARLEALRHEFEQGQKMLAELDNKRDNLTRTMLRIEGAIQVLRETLEKEEKAEE